MSDNREFVRFQKQYQNRSGGRQSMVLEHHQKQCIACSVNLDFSSRQGREGGTSRPVSEQGVRDGYTCTECGTEVLMDGEDLILMINPRYIDKIMNHYPHLPWDKKR